MARRPQLTRLACLPYRATEKRKAEAERIRQKYPDRIPVSQAADIIERYAAAASATTVAAAAPPSFAREDIRKAAS